MNYRLIHQLPPSENNPRNSEGAFLRGKKGEILFAYSRYHGGDNNDHAPCDIYLITSYDEGESWSEPRCIATADFYGTKNIMSVSAMEQKNGDLAFYFLIKENDFTTTIGRTVSTDGEHFEPERCICNIPPAYYVINNDRFIRLADGRIAAPAAALPAESLIRDERVPAAAMVLLSEDDGKTFTRTQWEDSTTDRIHARHGYQEPGLLEVGDRYYIWARTNGYCQYEAWSEKGVEGFETFQPSQFTSPASPMQIKKMAGSYYAVYNPIPAHNCMNRHDPNHWCRTPWVIRKSADCVAFGPLNYIESSDERGYCYPALFETNDGHILIAYCRGNAADGNVLCRLGIGKIEINSIE